MIGIILLAVTITLMKRRIQDIIYPVDIVTKRLVKLAEGDLKTPVEEINTGDELAVLSSNLEHTIQIRGKSGYRDRSRVRGGFCQLKRIHRYHYQLL